MAKVVGIILAAGLSSRMGSVNKLFLPFAQSTIVASVIAKVEASMIDELVIVTSSLSHERLKGYRSDRIKVVQNPEYEQGMTTSIQAGVRASKEAHYMICLGDQPTLQTSTYNLLVSRFEGQKDPRAIVMPFYKGQKGNPVIFSNYYKSDILNHHEPEGCRQLVKENQEYLLKVNVDDHGVLMDIDTREEYERLNPSRS